MVRLTEILNEQKDLGKLLKLIQTDFVVYRDPLYRGTDYEIDKYEIRKARTNRKALSTSQPTQNVVSILTDQFYPNHPNRARSKFATAHEPEASTYGENTYYIFPHKSAKVKFYPKDTYHGYFSLMSGLYESFYADFTENRIEFSNLVSELSDSRIHRLIESIFMLVTGLGHQSFKDVIGEYNNLDEMKEELSQYVEDERSSDNNRLMYPYKNFYKFLDKALQYFEDASDKFISGDSEVVIESKYLSVNQNFLEEDYVWR